jgi:hypothetical protein
MTYAILATGPTMSQAVADSVRGRCRVIAVSDAYRLAPWADALVSSDAAWWRHHKPEFEGARFSTRGHHDTSKIEGVPGSMNSGAYAVEVARQLGAKRIVLLGFDGHGTHFFGDHDAPLRNMGEERHKPHAKQHALQAAACAAAGVEIWNCTPGTAIPHYSKANLEDVLC